MFEKKSLRSLAAVVILGFVSLPTRSLRAEDPGLEEWGQCYADGVTLYNLNRLGEAFKNFECAIRKNQNPKEAAGYLIQIRQEIVGAAKERLQEQTVINFSADSPEGALTVAYLEKGHLKITLRAKYLFEENSASLKNTSMDVLNRLGDILRTKSENRIELTLIDDLQNTPHSQSVDAQRALTIFALLNFKKTV